MQADPGLKAPPPPIFLTLNVKRISSAFNLNPYFRACGPYTAGSSADSTLTIVSGDARLILSTDGRIKLLRVQSEVGGAEVQAQPRPLNSALFQKEFTNLIKR